MNCAPLSVVVNYALSYREGRVLTLFDPNNTFMYCLVAVVIIFVIAMSVRFIVLAWKRARKLGISTQVLRRTAMSAAVFTVVPAISILLGVIALSKALGFPLPWLRLSVIGALTYETPAAASAAQAVGTDLSQLITEPRVFAAIACVMTLGIVPGTIREGLRGWIPFFVMVVSAILMCVCALFVKVLKWKWMEQYALPLSMLGGMFLAIPITNLVDSLV